MTAVKPTSSADISISTSSVVIMAMPRSPLPQASRQAATKRKEGASFADISVHARKTSDVDRRRDVIADVVLGRLRDVLGSDAEMDVDLADLIRVVGDAGERLRLEMVHQPRQPGRRRRGVVDVVADHQRAEHAGALAPGARRVGGL